MANSLFKRAAGNCSGKIIRQQEINPWLVLAF